MKPLVKWVGGKTRLLGPIKELIGALPIQRYFEPFLGGGAVFFDLQAQIEEAHLSDVNCQLVGLYCDVGEWVEELQGEVECLKGLDYYSIRRRYNAMKKDGDPDVSALLLALLTLGFNGLYRENRSGEMNTPIGKDSKGRPHSLDRIDWDHVWECSRALKRAHSIISGDWRVALTRCGVPREGDVYFFDPPYIDQFSEYSEGGFKLHDHRALAECSRVLGGIGARVVVCGSDCEASLAIYGEPTLRVANHGTFGVGLRPKVREALWAFGPERK